MPICQEATFVSQADVVDHLKYVAAAHCFLMRWCDGDFAFAGVRCAIREGDAPKISFELSGGAPKASSDYALVAMSINARMCWLTAKAIEAGLSPEHPGEAEFIVRNSENGKGWPVPWEMNSQEGLLIAQKRGSKIQERALIGLDCLFHMSPAGEPVHSRFPAGDLYIVSFPSANGQADYDLIDFEFDRHRGEVFSKTLLEACLEDEMEKYERGEKTEVELGWLE